MKDRNQQILTQAMTLSAMERAELVEELFALFDFQSTHGYRCRMGC